MLHSKFIIEEGRRTNRVSEAFRVMAEELERERQAEPPFWQRPPPEARYLLRDLAVALLLALLVSAIGIAWIVGWE